MQLTPRDSKLFEIFRDYGVLTTTNIKETIFTQCSKKALLRRLNKLERGEFIKRILSPYQENAWILTHRGARVIGEEKSKKVHINQNTLNHDLLLSELRLVLEKENIGTNWQLEHNIRHRVFSEREFIDRE